MFGALIGAGASLLGSALSSRSSDKANRMSMDMAKHGISYKVADAKSAGIHPLYALGASTSSPSFQATDYSGIAHAGQQLAGAFGIDKEIKKAQLEQIKAQTRKINSDAVATSLEASKNMAQHNQIRGIGSPRTATLPGHDVASLDEKVNPTVLPFGNKLVPKRGRTTVQSLEDYYGELVSLPAGVFAAIEDMINTYGLNRRYNYIKKRLNSSTNGGGSW